MRAAIAGIVAPENGGFRVVKHTMMEDFHTDAVVFPSTQRNKGHPKASLGIVSHDCDESNTEVKVMFTKKKTLNESEFFCQSLLISCDSSGARERT